MVSLFFNKLLSIDGTFTFLESVAKQTWRSLKGNKTSNKNTDVIHALYFNVRHLHGKNANIMMGTCPFANVISLVHTLLESSTQISKVKL